MTEKESLPVLPMKDPEVVVFPGVYCKIEVGRPFSVNAVAAARAGDGRIVIALQKSKDVDNPTEKDFFTMACEAEIKSVVNREGGALHVVVQGTRRANLVTLARPKKDGTAHYSGEIVATEEPSFEITSEIKEELLQLKEMISDGMQAINLPQDDMPDTSEKVSKFVDIIASQLPITGRGRLKLLRLKDTKKRLSSVLQIVASITKHSDVTIESAPPAEDGDAEEGNVAISELHRLKKLIEGSKIEGEALKTVKREFRRLQMIPPNSAEFQVAFNYIETLASLPWGIFTEDKVDIDAARESLDQDHFGLDKVKDRILEFLAVRKLAPDKKGSILCFAGPPGVGKTSLGRSIAKAMGRNFIRMSLGGVNDEAEIRGHRRTYVGAMPGKVIQMLKKVGSSNPVFMLDEVDKVCRNLRGDPSASLLEVLDPEQNDSFLDNYLGIPYDLSQTMFIATVNDISAVPPALRDRMEVIEIAGYSSFDKIKIAQSHLVSKKREENGLKDYEISVSANALSKIIEEYTSEAGVRSLERYCGTLMRKMAVIVASEDTPPSMIKVDMIPKLLGPPKVIAERAVERPEVGLSAGLAWSVNGGSLLFVETSLHPGKGEIELTGNLGKVIQESAKAAHSWIKSHAAELGVDIEEMNRKNVHIHFPSGAIPKDGPSAGIAVASSMLSAIIGKPVRNDIAMTGEISLRGRVMPIGGLREKVLAAHRAGIKQVLYPTKNEHDLEEIPDEVKKEMTLTPVSDLSDALSILILDSDDGYSSGDISSGNTEPLINRSV